MESRNERIKREGKFKRKTKVNYITSSVAISSLLIGGTHFSSATYGAYNEVEMTNAIISTAFVFPSTVESLVESANSELENIKSSRNLWSWNWAKPSLQNGLSVSQPNTSQFMLEFAFIKKMHLKALKGGAGLISSHVNTLSDKQTEIDAVLNNIREIEEELASYNVRAQNENVNSILEYVQPAYEKGVDIREQAEEISLNNSEKITFWKSMLVDINFEIERLEAEIASAEAEAKRLQELEEQKKLEEQQALIEEQEELASEEASEEQEESVSEEASEEQEESASEEASEEQEESTSEEASEEQEESTSEEASEEQEESTSEEASEEQEESTSEEASEEQEESTSEEASEEQEESTSEEASEEQEESTSEEASEEQEESTSEEVSEEQEESTSEGASEEEQEDPGENVGNPGEQGEE
ncbi:hypothetical protein V1503_05900 [Bacillus sp. SCS-151]|uniref:hypothetical protein n=1 Tax=Nanhaiella sioensis TaxID=3115293 RepID=UPI00397E2B55